MTTLMRDINKVIVHCSATPAGRDVTIADVRRWHVEGNGWSDVGYHFFIRLDGQIELGRDLNTPGAHTQGYNKKSIGVCYAGGMSEDMSEPEDTRTDEQKDSLEVLLATLVRMFPGLEIYGHRDFSPKACPSFDAKNEYKHLL